MSDKTIAENQPCHYVGCLASFGLDCNCADIRIEEAAVSDKTIDRLTERADLLNTLRRIREKADIALREDGGKWARQALDAIDEIAEKAIRLAEGQP